MPFDFDAEFGDENEDTVSSGADAVVNDLTDSTPESFDEQMSEVEKRLEVASYYRLLLNDTIFGDRTETALIVEKEIRVFIRDRLGVLLNIKAADQKPEPVAAQFTDEEAKILRVLAAKVLNKPALLDAPKPAAAKPELRKVATPTKPQMAVQAPAQSPVVKKKPGPMPGKKPAPKPQQMIDGDPVVVENGKRYRMHTKEDGTVVKIDLTTQVRARKAVPFPSKEAMESITAAQANESVVKSGALDGGSGGQALAGAMQQLAVARAVREED